MDATLQRLLEAEMQAEKIQREAEEQREQVIQDAMQEAKAAEARFEASLPDMYTSYQEKAESRAEQTIAELKRRFDERHTQLWEYADAREDKALDAAFEILIDPDIDE